MEAYGAAQEDIGDGKTVMEEIMMRSVFFWGSKFIDCLSDYFSDELYTKSKQIDISPISDCHCGRTGNEIVEWRKEIDEIWRETTPEYLVIDMRGVQQLLYQDEDRLMTLVSQNISDIDAAKTVMPDLFYGKKMYRKLVPFIETICSHFDSNHIILIRAHVPKYYATGTQLRRNKQYKEQMQHIQMVKMAEAYFLKKTGAVTIDLTRFYFYEKEVGYELTDYIYERECFQDLAGKISGYILNDRENTEELNLPDFSISLQRYCKYYDCTILFDAFSVFLREQNLLESMILCSPKDFVMTYFDELLKLHHVMSDVESLEETDLERIRLDIVKIVRAYDAVRQENYTDETIDYALLFRSQIISQSLLSRIKKECQEQKIVEGKLINYHNAGYYFARMQGFPEERALTFVKDKTVLRPELVDIFGSCVTRTCLRNRFTNNHTCAVNNYWFHVPVYESLGHPISYPAEIFEGKLDRKDMNVKIQFDHALWSEIESSEATWLIVDLYSLMSPKTFKYHDLIYTDTNQKISAQLGAEHVDIIKDKSLMGDYDDILHRMLPWCEAVKRKYGDHIICIDVNSSPYTIGDDDIIYEVRNKNVIAPKNDLMARAYEYVKQQTDCYCLKIACGFIADDIGYLNRGSVHYSLCFYRIIFDLVNEIIAKKPEQKLFDSYPAEIRTARIRRLLPKNDPHFLRKYFTNDVDNWVLQLPTELLDKYQDQILRWYDLGLTDRSMLLKLYEDDPHYDELKNAIRNMEDSILYESACVLPKDYKKYGDYSLLTQGAGKVKHFTVKYDGNGADTGSMKPLDIVWGVKTKLRKNKFQKYGYRFAGWKARRKSDGKICYTNQEIRRYYLEGGQPPGYELYFYPDKCVVAELSSVDNDEIILYAQWEINHESGEGGYSAGTGDITAKENSQMKRIITYGTYDSIQYEHIEFLKGARALGDYLVVALFSDEYSLKENGGNASPYEKRKALLEALRYVDLVIPVNSREQIVSELREYHIDTIVLDEASRGSFGFLERGGCEVIYLPQTVETGTVLPRKDQESCRKLDSPVRTFYFSPEKRKELEQEYRELVVQNGMEMPKRSVNDNYYTRKLEENSILVCGLGVNVRGNMQYVLNELNHNDRYANFKIYVRTKDRTDEIVKGYIRQNHWDRTETVSTNYNARLESCKYLITESYFPYSWVKRPGQIVINIWHGTPLKCIGFAKSGKFCHVNGPQQKNFICADYLLYPNQYTKEKNLSSYRIESLLPGKALMLGYPRTGGMLSITRERQEEIRKELAPAGEKIYAYMPTWKGYLDNEETVAQTKELLKYLDQNLRDDQILYVNLHHKISDSLDYSYFGRIKQFPPLLDSYELLSATDALITDYSSVFFDYLALRKQIILDVGDYKAYLQHQGLYIDVEKLPFDKAYSPKEIIEALNRGKEYDDAEIFSQICSYDSSDNAEKLCQVIVGDETGLDLQEHPKNDKCKVLVYSHYFAAGEETDILEKFTKEYDRDRFEIYLSCNQETVNETVGISKAYPMLYDNFVISTSNDEAWITALGKCAKALYLHQIISFEKAMELLSYDYALIPKRFYGDTRFDSVWIYDVLDPELILGLALADSHTKSLFLSQIQMKQILEGGDRFLRDAIIYAASLCNTVFVFSDEGLPLAESILGDEWRDRIGIIHSEDDMEKLLRQHSAAMPV